MRPLLTGLALRSLLLTVDSPRLGSVRMEITVCTGGQCAENGGDLLYDACSALAGTTTALLSFNDSTAPSSL